MGTARELVVGSGSWLFTLSVSSRSEKLQNVRNAYPAWSWSVSKFLLRSDMVADG